MSSSIGQTMPLEPRPAVAECRSRSVEPACAQDAGSGFRPLPGSVPFDVYLEGSNRIARELDTFSLSRAAREMQQPSSREPSTSRSTPPSQAAPKTGWAKLGEVLSSAWASAHGAPPPAPVQKAPEPITTVTRHTGTGRMIDVIA